MILINIDMPNSCLRCPMANKYDGYGQLQGCLAVQGKEYAAIDERYEDKPSWCPLIELPPHGDLIDRNTAYDSILNGMVMTGYQSRALDCISDYSVPTIIEAEEGE